MRFSSSPLAGSSSTPSVSFPLPLLLVAPLAPTPIPTPTPIPFELLLANLPLVLPPAPDPAPDPEPVAIVVVVGFVEGCDCGRSPPAPALLVLRFVPLPVPFVSPDPSSRRLGSICGSVMNDARGQLGVNSEIAGRERESESRGPMGRQTSFLARACAAGRCGTETLLRG